MTEEAILLVDDDPLILRTMAPTLEREGYAVRTAATGERALEVLGGPPFGLVITDLVMDRIDGIAVLQRAKQVDPACMVMILTGHGDLDSAIAALRLGADDYLLKPCEAPELFFRVRTCFDKRALSRKINLYEAILPVCATCKAIRDDTGVEPGSGPWFSLEEYLGRRTGVRITHTYCPSCAIEAIHELESDDLPV